MLSNGAVGPDLPPRTGIKLEGRADAQAFTVANGVSDSGRSRESSTAAVR